MLQSAIAQINVFNNRSFVVEVMSLLTLILPVSLALFYSELNSPHTLTVKLHFT